MNERFVGIENEEEYLRLGKVRKIETENTSVRQQFIEKISGFNNRELSNILQAELKQT